MVAFDLVYGPGFYFFADHPEDLVLPPGLLILKQVGVFFQEGCIAMALLDTPPVPLLPPHLLQRNLRLVRYVLYLVNSLRKIQADVIEH